MKGSGNKTRDLPRRFYKAAGVAPRSDELGGGWYILLDGRAVKTPLRADLVLPAKPLAQAIASEWDAQGELIDPRLMPLTKLANSTLDGVCGRLAEVAADIVKYAARDLLCYRADTPEALVERQKRAWDPLLAWAKDECGATLTATSGIMPIEQPAAAIEALGRRVATLDAFSLSAIHTITTLTGSAVLALAHAAGRISVQECWTAAHVDEDFQIEQWGEDAEAKARRAARLAEMHAAVKFFALSR